jgi:hypothetical protein
VVTKGGDNSDAGEPDDVDVEQFQQPPVSMSAMLDCMATLRRFCAERAIDPSTNLDAIEVALINSRTSRQTFITDFFLPTS